MFFANVQYIRLIIISVCLAGLCWGCNMRDPLPIAIEDIQCHKVKVAPGPEDFVLDTSHGGPRLLVSSHDRRDPETSGGIYYFDIKTEKTSEMLRLDEPDKIAAFKPHGMDIRIDGHRTLLYVIIHDPYAHEERLENAVIIYEVIQNHLCFVELLEDAELLWSPNDLSVLPSGDIYLTNDIHGSLDMYTRSKSSEIVYYDHKAKTWKMVADDIAFANGILAESNRVYVTATLDDQILVFPREENGELGTPEQVVHVKGADNLMRYKNSLLTTAHYDDMAFLNHKNNSENYAPSVVFRIRPEMYAKDTVFVDDGKMISAASTAMIYRDKLYISQVFDPYIVVCDIPVFMR
ncbi:MAG: SMP-30/gluconolactonase/LRE family protein [Desulfobacteraceae bacterium]|jgi:arylesterase/paraoxonase|nr:SMP-30/gluconolactonase/LRE family protein [Desulfobacteraceae bacterium]